MNRSLLRRKSRFGSSKGISTAIATVFLVLTVFVLSTNVFIWTFSQNALYNQAAKTRNQQDFDRLTENIIATNTTYVVPSTSTINVTTTIVNGGSTSAQIVTLWVLDATLQKYNVTNLQANNNLNPGDRRTFSKTVQILNAASTDSFSAWFVTAKGNNVELALEAAQTIIVANIAQGIGSMVLNFPLFRYFTYETSNKLANYPNGNTNFTVPSRTNIAFGTVLTNLDPAKQTITLNQYSQVWLYFPKSPGQSTVFYIVKVAPDGTITTPYSSITLAYRETTLVVFASASSGELNSVSIAAAVENLPCALNLLLLGTIGARDYGQNIPLVALNIYKP